MDIISPTNNNESLMYCRLCREPGTNWSPSIPLLNTQNKSNHLTAVFKQLCLAKPSNESVRPS